MKHLTLESFIRSLPEEEIWKLIDEYEKWYMFEDEERHSLLWKKTEEYCFDTGIRPVDIRIVAMGAYRHFALKYKESMKND
jgi:hypothetical protein